MKVYVIMEQYDEQIGIVEIHTDSERAHALADALEREADPGMGSDFYVVDFEVVG